MQGDWLTLLFVRTCDLNRVFGNDLKLRMYVIISNLVVFVIIITAYASQCLNLWSYLNYWMTLLNIFRQPIITQRQTNRWYLKQPATQVFPGFGVPSTTLTRLKPVKNSLTSVICEAVDNQRIILPLMVTEEWFFWCILKVFLRVLFMPM